MCLFNYSKTYTGGTPASTQADPSIPTTEPTIAPQKEKRRFSPTAACFIPPMSEGGTKLRHIPLRVSSRSLELPARLHRSQLEIATCGSCSGLRFGKRVLRRALKLVNRLTRVSGCFIQPAMLLHRLIGRVPCTIPFVTSFQRTA